MNDIINVISKKKTIKAHLTTTPSATTDKAGIIRIATIGEALEGVDSLTAITPLSLKYVGDNKYADTIEVSLDEDYVLTITLKSANGDTLSTQSIDFPSEYAITDIEYDEDTTSLIFTLQNGTTFETEIMGLQAEINNNNKLSSDLVDDNNKSNKFVSTTQKDLLDDLIVNANELNSLENITDNVQSQLNNITDNLSNLSTTVTNNYTTLDEKIDSTEDTLSDTIDDEITARINADTTLQGNIDTLSGTVTSNYNTLDGKIGDNKTAIDNHKADKDNPHEVTKSQVGLGNVDNTSDLDKPISTATQTALDGKVDKLSTKPTAGTYTKVDINAEGQVTSGTTLQASDIPSLNLTKISDVTTTANELNQLHEAGAVKSDFEKLHAVTASATELNTLDGITASTSELNILDGATVTTNELNVLDGITASTTELNYTDGVTSNIQTQLDGKQPTITGGATTITSSDLTTARALISDNNGKVVVSDITTTELSYLDGVTSNVQSQIGDITDLIPSAASTTNELADKNFVNSTVSTNTANFIGTFNSVADLNAYSGTVTNNDYAFVITTDALGNSAYDRYKYTTATTPASWIFEYELNNSSFTSDQWAAINSLITAATKVTHTANTAVGGTTTPVYVNANGEVTPLSYTLAKSVPSDAKFTDTTYTIGTGSANGTIAVNNSDVAVKGLGSAAYTPSSDYATSAQGSKADSAVQSVATGSTNGTIDVDGSDVAVYGLGSAAYTNSSDYATSTQGGKADTAVQPSDLATVATTGDYGDLLNKPTIPTVNDGTITLTQDGVTKGTFTVNQSGDTTISLDAGGDVDQTFDGESTNAQSGVAIAGELENYQKKLTAGSNISISSGTNVSDITDWSSLVQPLELANTTWEFVSYADDLYIAFGSHNSNTVATSNDGINWTVNNNARGLYGYPCVKVIKIGDYYYGIAQEGYIFSSIDGLDWRYTSLQSLTRDIVDMIYDGTKYILLNKYGYIDVTDTLSSNRTWNTYQIPNYNDDKFISLIYDGNNYIAATSDGGLSISSDAINWSSVSYIIPLYSGSSSIISLIYNNNRYIAFSNDNNYCYVSTADDYSQWNYPEQISELNITPIGFANANAQILTMDAQGYVSICGDNGAIISAVGVEVLSNKVTSLSSSSTDTEYPSAKCVYDIIGDIETLLSQV